MQVGKEHGRTCHRKGGSKLQMTLVDRYHTDNSETGSQKLGTNSHRITDGSTRLQKYVVIIVFEFAEIMIGSCLAPVVIVRSY
jgi:hypothetical protein